MVKIQDITNATAFQLVNLLKLFDKSNKKSLIIFSFKVFELFQKSLKKFNSIFVIRFKLAKDWNQMSKCFDNPNISIENLKFLEFIEDELTSIINKQDLTIIETDLKELLNLDITECMISDTQLFESLVV